MSRDKAYLQDVIESFELAIRHTFRVSELNLNNTSYRELRVVEVQF